MNNTGEVPNNPLEIIQGDLERKSAVAEANATALPGPLKAVFTLQPDIDLGKYKIRPFFDADWEILEFLNHPIRLLKSGDVDAYQPTGADARLLAYLFTKPIRDARKAASEGRASIQALADDEFVEFDMQAHLAVSKAVYQQIERYWEPVIRYKAETDESEKKT